MVLKNHTSVQFSSSVVSDSLRPHESNTSGLPIHHQLPEFPQTHVHWISDAIQPSHPLSFLPLPALNLSQHQGLFKRVSSSHQVAKHWSVSFNISPSSEHPGLISFRMDWLDLLAVQGTLKSLLQHHSLRPTVIQHWAFFIVQPSHPYMTTGKTIALSRQTFVDKVIPLLFNMLSRFLGGSDGKASAYNAGDLGSIPGSGRSPGEGNGNPLQYSCLENPMTEEPGRL